MGSADESETARALTNYRTAIVAGVIAAVGLIILIVAGLWQWLGTMPPVRSVVEEIGGLLFVTGALTAFWDLRGRRDLINEVLAKARISTEVKTAGLSGVSMDWNAIPWATYINDCRELTVFIAYGTSWRNVHWPQLSEFASKKGAALTVILPDPDDEPTMAILGQRFTYTPEKVAGLVREMAQAMASLDKPRGATIKIYYRAGDPTYTLYRFDRRFVVTLYANRRARGNVPAFTVEEGSLHAFFSEDLAAIVQQSKPVDLIELKEEAAK